jgi:hypothetical protein
LWRSLVTLLKESYEVFAANSSRLSENIVTRVVRAASITTAVHVPRYDTIGIQYEMPRVGI